MAVKISRAVYDGLIAEAAKNPDVECCGLLFGGSERIDTFEATENVASSPARHFEIDPVALLRANRLCRNGGPQLAGYFHSHPDGRAAPSARDRAAAAPDEMLWAIVARRQIGLWRSRTDGFSPITICIVD